MVIEQLDLEGVVMLSRVSRELRSLANSGFPMWLKRQLVVSFSLAEAGFVRGQVEGECRLLCFQLAAGGAVERWLRLTEE